MGGLDKYLNPKDTRTDEQKLAMRILIYGALQKWPDIKVAGHYNFSPKSCPCFNVQQWCESIGILEKNIYRKLLKK